MRWPPYLHWVPKSTVEQMDAVRAQLRADATDLRAENRRLEAELDRLLRELGRLEGVHELSKHYANELRLAQARIAVLEGRTDKQVEQLVALHREGFSQPPTMPADAAVAPVELPADIRKAIGQWPNDSVVRRDLERFAVEALRGGADVSDVVAKIQSGDSVDDLLD